MKVGLDASLLIASVKTQGEKFHQAALGLANMISAKAHVGVCSALLLIELPGALASSTTMPVEKIFEVEQSVLHAFSVKISPFELNSDRAVDLMFEFRALKRRWRIGSADFHYLATAYNEGCDFFVTTDEKHLLRRECKEAFSKYLPVCSPDDALDRL